MKRIDLDYGAIALDNTTLKSEGYKFHEGLLLQMRQFKNSPVQVLQSDVVHNEAVKHIAQEIVKTRSSIEQALRSAHKQLQKSAKDIDSARALLSTDGNELAIASDRLDNYYSTIGAEKVLSKEHVDLSVLMRMYFSTEAPFELGKDKKNEFPDAIALLGLERWAENADVNIIAVTQDKGWANYAASSSRITSVSSLAEALERFQPHNKVVSIIARIREDSLLEGDNHVLSSIEQAIVDSVDGYGVQVDASSYMHFEWDDTSADHLSHELDCDEQGLVQVRVVSIEDGFVVLKTGATVEVEVEANFSFSVRDSIDKDYFYMGSNVVRTKETYHTDILVTVAGDFSLDLEGVEVIEIAVLETIAQADFGDVNPDWSNDYEEL